jgi:UDP-sugar transporter A1/2/3
MLSTPSALGPWTSFVIMGIYMSGCISQYLLISWAKTKGNESSFNNDAAVLLTEIYKWIFCVVMIYYRSGKLVAFEEKSTAKANISFFLSRYVLISLIYSLYNNLTYWNLARVDPGTFQVYMQTRVIFTGVFYQLFMKKVLSKQKWAGLILLMVAMVIKYDITHDNSMLNFSILGIVFQASLSSFAGAYNEYVLKSDDHIDVFESNFYMYSVSIVSILI